MTAKTVAIGVALVLVGVLVGLNVPIAEAQRDGPYALSATDSGVWRMNLRTGQVSICGVTLAPKAIPFFRRSGKNPSVRRGFLPTDANDITP